MLSILMTTTAEDAAAEPGEGATFEVENPATGRVIEHVPEHSREDVEAAVGRAAGAQAAWASRSIDERREVIARVRELLLERRDDLAETVSAETGKPPGEAIGSDVGASLDACTYLIDEGPDIVEEPIDLGGLTAVGDSTVVREPIGVVGVITPWNYPLCLPAMEALPPLFAGNAVVLKPAEQTPLSALELEALFHEAGVPSDVFQVVTGRGRPTGEALSEADLEHLSFTGSTEVGFELRESCKARGVTTSLELGGSDPAVVLEDADLDLTADGITWARFSNAGQTCAAPKRCFVHESLADAFTDAVVSRVDALEIGGGDDKPYEFGPVISAAALDTIASQVDRSVEMGAEVVTGGERLDREGHYYAPTVLRGVTRDMPVMREETFGPVLPIVPVHDADEGVEYANDTDYGLTASVWTTDVERGEALARRIEAGTITVNEHLYTSGVFATPWGGRKDSGGDFSHGRWSIEAVTEPKHIHVAPGEVSVREGRFRDLWWFPYGPDYGETIGRAMEAIHHSSTLQRLRRTPGTIRAALSK